MFLPRKSPSLGPPKIRDVQRNKRQQRLDRLCCFRLGLLVSPRKLTGVEDQAMADNRKIAWRTKAAPYLTTALALEIVALFGFAYLTDSHVPGISPLAAMSIFIDGTKDILPGTGVAIFTT